MFLAAKEAAAQIRADVAFQALDPDDVHRMNYLKEVAAELGVEPTGENLHHISDVLHQHDIEVPAGRKYPKYMGKGKFGNDLIAHDEDEEQEILDAQKDPDEAGKPDEPEPAGDPNFNDSTDDNPDEPYTPGALPGDEGGPSSSDSASPKASPVSPKGETVKVKK